jgi:hypothetical protein
LITTAKIYHLAQAQTRQMRELSFLTIKMNQVSLIQNLLVLVIVIILRKPGL